MSLHEVTVYNTGQLPEDYEPHGPGMYLVGAHVPGYTDRGWIVDLYSTIIETEFAPSEMCGVRHHRTIELREIPQPARDGMFTARIQLAGHLHIRARHVESVLVWRHSGNCPP